MSVTSVRLQKMCELKGWKEGGETTSSQRLVSSQWERASVPGADPDRESEAQVHALFSYYSFIFLFCQVEKSSDPREENGRHSHSHHPLINFCPIPKVSGTWDIFFFLHGLAPHSHLDGKRCSENEAKALTWCLSFTLLSVIKENSWLYVMCPHLRVSAIFQ